MIRICIWAKKNHKKVKRRNIKQFPLIRVRKLIDR
jgi:hypothetical protein